MSTTQKWIRGRAPDVVLLQELWLPEDAEYLERALRSSAAGRRRPSYRLIGDVDTTLALNPFLPFVGPLALPYTLTHPFRKGGLAALVRDRGAWTVESDDFREYESEASSLYFWQGDGQADKGAQRVTLRHASGQRVGVVTLHDRDRPLSDNGAPIVLLAHEVDRDAAHLAASVDHGLVDPPTVHAMTAEGWQEGGVDVDHPAPERAHDRGRNQPKVSGKHDQLDVRFPDAAQQKRLIALRVFLEILGRRWQHFGPHFRLSRPVQRPDPGSTADDEYDTGRWVVAEVEAV